MSNWADLYQDFLAGAENAPEMDAEEAPAFVSIVSTVSTPLGEEGILTDVKNSRKTEISDTVDTVDTNLAQGCASAEGETTACARPFSEAFAALEADCPALVDASDWKTAVEGARSFLAVWGEAASHLGWSADDLFGLPPPPEAPAPNYQRLRRTDQLGLVWLLRGRSVTSLSDQTATIRTSTGGTLTFTRNAARAASIRRKRSNGLLDDDMTTDEQIAKALGDIAIHLKYLGLGNAGTTMGAVEFFTVETKRGLERLANSIDEHGAAVERGLNGIATAIDRVVDRGIEGIVTEEIASAIDTAVTKIVRPVADE